MRYLEAGSAGAISSWEPNRMNWSLTLSEEVKEPLIKATSYAGAEISPLRPKYSEKTPPCIVHCPNGTDIRGWLTSIAQAEDFGWTNEQAMELAWRKITAGNPFPAVCGRVCPHPCEANCSRKDKDGAVAINAMERFVGDFGIARGLKLTRLSKEKFPEKIAVIGSGPAGLSCAYQLSRRGYPVTVYEAFNLPGGMLRYGIPKYRLPRYVLDAEINRILDLGVKLKCNMVVGKDVSLEQLHQECKAIFVGIGAHKGLTLGVKGEDAGNVFTGTEFLNRANSGDDVEVGRNVAVIGGGDTAIDAARVSKRLGAEVTILYRRTKTEMPAIASEIGGALEEGVKIEFLAAPIEVLRNSRSAVGLRCIRMELGPPDSSGRPRPVPISGSEFEVDATTIIAAIGQEPNFDYIPGLREGKDWIKVDDWGATKNARIYAGGDDVELGLVITAIARGRFAADAIDACLRNKQLNKPAPLPEAKNVILDWYREMGPHERSRVPVEQREMDTEIEAGLSEDDAIDEAKRCMSCGLCMDCETCWMYCTNNCFVRLPKGEHYKIKLEACNGCKKCAEACPTGYIDLI
jgi:NADPH-dependent glutamate synthase beta subunit-like oxidoreductase/Pyruvate/2-oxoacid:ferredoxin oxidoreductase delta subunit